MASQTQSPSGPKRVVFILILGSIYLWVLWLLCFVASFVVNFALDSRVPALLVNLGVIVPVALFFALFVRSTFPDRCVSSALWISLTMIVELQIAVMVSEGAGYFRSLLGIGGSIACVVALPLLASMLASPPPNTSLERTRER